MRVLLGWGATLLGLGLLAGCAQGPELVPAASAREVRGEDFAALSQVAGVRVEVDTDAWEADPERLEAVVPLKVTVENHSGRPLRLRFREFALVGEGGERFAALPPLSIDGLALVDEPAADLDEAERQAWLEQGPEAVGGAGGLEPMPLSTPLDPAFEHEGYFVSPTYGPFWRGIEPWVGLFTADPLYYEVYQRQWPVRLPTEDMVARALPEGVLSHGGEVAGFLYFQDVPQGVRQVRFLLELVDAETGQSFGTVRIPLRPREA